MKITKLSLVAIATMGIMSGVNADVDVNIGGQGVLYYQTADGFGNGDLFDKNSVNKAGAAQTRANLGLQLNANADIGNGFGLGLQGTALNALGLANNLVSNVMQSGGGDLNGDSKDYFGITKAYLTKKINNTTLKFGRQELPKSLSPLAFSENWNVFKNTFDAIVAINSDIQDTTIVGAYVSGSNGNGMANDMSTFNNLGAKLKNGSTLGVAKGAYMLTVANKSIKEAPITLTYYTLDPGKDAKVDAIWGDVQVDAGTLLQAGTPIKVGLQGGQIMPDMAGTDDTAAVGVKVAGKAGPANLQLAYSKVGGGTAYVKNVGTGVKTPLYTQMVANQDHISRAADTFVLKGVMPVSAGKVIAQYGITTDNAHDNDYNELDLLYKFKALGTNMLVAYVMQDDDAHDDPNNILRFWTRYNF